MPILEYIKLELFVKTLFAKAVVFFVLVWYNQFENCGFDDES